MVVFAYLTDRANNQALAYTLSLVAASYHTTGIDNVEETTEAEQFGKQVVALS